MGGGNKERKAAQTNYDTALSETKAESPYEKKRREFSEGIIDWSKKEDYRNPTAAMKVFYNFADPAERKRQSDLNANTRGLGVSALGAGANPTALALDKQHRDDVNATDAARQYQETTANLVGGAYDELGDLHAASDAKKLGVLGVTNSRLGQEREIASRPKWFEKILTAGAQIGSGAATGYAGSAIGSAKIAAMLKDGGRVDPYIGKKVLTGEEGPELLVEDDGDVKPLGLDGPEVITPDSPGYVVPNDELPPAANVARKSPRAPMDERTPNGASVDELVAQVNGRQADKSAAPIGAPAARPRIAKPVAHVMNREVEAGGGLPVEPDRTVPSGEVSQKPLAPHIDVSDTPASRPRFADPHGRLEKQIAHEQLNPEKDKNGWKGVAREAVLGFLQNGVFGAAARGIGNMLDKSGDERTGQAQAVQRWQTELNQGRANEKAGLDREQQRAGIRLTNANARYAEEFKPLEAQQKAEQRERTLIKANLGSLKGQKLDPSNPRHARFLERAERAGYFIDPDEWNNAASNQVTITVVDPNNPTQTRQQFYNKATGEITDVAQKGYVQPVKKSGMTESQERADGDRDAARDEARARFEKTFGLGVANYERNLRNGLTSEAKRTFDVETKGDFQRAKDIEKQLADIRRQIGEGTLRASDVQADVDRLRAEAAQLATKVEAARSKYGAAVTGGSSSAPAAGGKYRGQRFSRSKLEAMRPDFGGKSAAEVERIITQNGGVVY
ncbi:MAG TPA: hypothetical protein VK363_19260 [Pyrinomonadaceae bacterium]|nr:hypothetical protein [Pyrinomonadaceae bacterium]